MSHIKKNISIHIKNALNLLAYSFLFVFIIKNAFYFPRVYKKTKNNKKNNLLNKINKNKK